MIRFSLLIFGMTLMLGCTGGSANNAVDNSTNPSSSPTTPPSAPTVTQSSPLALTIFTIYDNTQAVENQTFLETGTTTCQTSTTTPVVTCTVVIPEGRLYYSSLNFNFSWTTTSCKLLTFQPYFYRASTSGNYTAPGASAMIDCSGSTSPPGAACWGGAAPQLVPQFPKYSALIYLPNEALTSGPQSTTAKMPSGYSLSTSSNRTVVNDMAPANYGTSFTPAQIGVYNPSGSPTPNYPGDGYVANSMVNYSFTCRDDWYDPVSYTINLVVKDQNDDPSGAQTEDDFYTWSEL